MAVDEKQKYRALVKAAQQLLRSEDSTIAVDGIWGRQSEAALVRARGEVKELAQKVKAFSDTQKPAPKATSAGQWISRREAERLIDNAAKVAEIPKEWLLFMLDLEPVRRNSAGGVEYRVDSVSPGGSYYGLMQVGRDAWTDAAEIFPFIGSFEANKFDPALNVMAAAGFAKRNVGYARGRLHRYQGEFTPELIYAMHNQGHSFLSSASAGGSGNYYSGQSTEAKRVLDQASDHVRREVA